MKMWKYEGDIQGLRVQSVLNQESTESIVDGMIRDRFVIRDSEKILKRGTVFLEDGTRWRVGLLGDRVAIVGEEDALVWEEMVV